MDTVKITSGNLRGRTLFTPGGNTHPMGAREKLALFNMISSYLKDATVLDAYAGSGASRPFPEVQAKSFLLKKMPKPPKSSDKT